MPEIKLGAHAGRTAAHIMNKINEQNEAIMILTKILEIYPDDIHLDKSKFFLAQLYEKNLNYKEAFILYQQIITQHPTSLYFEESRIRARELNSEFMNQNING